ncbi:hypothetical protein PL9631_160011 [Planktothrix paucivesiculata PCC 9631]|uniref:Uncharacterized protein n=1 Tax=Planktothrix paucivesiculata PCC 9631 TaxID=671071 RepID=A0A7Z9BME1_9CYAN|nr:hypothetical protein PL9631_160011 [Planktothrix paucivesiculata PCC 9631]
MWRTLTAGIVGRGEQGEQGRQGGKLLTVPCSLFPIPYSLIN